MVTPGGRGVGRAASRFCCSSPVRRSADSLSKALRIFLVSDTIYFGHLMQRADSFEKTLMLGRIEGGRRRGQQRMRWLDGITDSMHLSKLGSWRWTGKPGVLQSMGLQGV